MAGKGTASISNQEELELQRFAETKEQESSYDEILKQPLPKIEFVGVWFSAIIVLITILTLYFVKINIIVQTIGVIVPEDEVYYIESDGGVVTKILAEEGSELKRGDPIMRLDYSENQIMPENVEDKLQGLSEELASLKNSNTKTAKLIKDVTGQLNQYSGSQLSGKILENLENLKKANSMLEKVNRYGKTSFGNRNKQTLEEIKLAEEKIELLIKNKKIAEQSLLEESKALNRKEDLLTEFKKLVEEGYYSKIELNQEEETYLTAVQEYRNKEKQLSDTDLLISDERIRYNNIIIKQQEGKKQFEQKVKDAKANYKKALDSFSKSFSKSIIRMPFDGIVGEIKVNNEGQTVASGEVVAVVIPGDSSMEMKATIKNKDIGFIKEGLTTSVKVDAYPYKEFGVVPAVVRKVIPNVEGEGSAFSVIIKLNKQSLEKSGERYNLFPGLSAAADIVIRKKRLFQFFFAKE